MASNIVPSGRQLRKELHPALNDEYPDFKLYVIEQSEGIRPQFPTFPHYSLPVGAYIKSVGDYVVLPKGKIVSIIGQSCDGTSGGLIEMDPDGIPIPEFEVPIDPYGDKPIEAMGDTTWPVEPAPTADPGFTTFNTADQDSYGAYPNEVYGVLIPANGGTDTTYDYSADDVGRTPDVDGDVVTTKTGPLAIAANKPLGIVYHDVYRYVTGRYLNWVNQSSVSLLTDWYIMVPFVNLYKLHAKLGVDRTWFGLVDNAELDNDNPLYVLSRLWAFAYADEYTGSYDCSCFRIAPGSTVYPDKHGNYIFDAIDPDFLSYECTEDPVDYFQRGYDEQKVGKLWVIDHRFPKQNLDYVDTYPGSGAGAGTDTGGIPWHLFHFASDLLLLGGIALSDRNISDIVDMTREGIFGMAYINLHVS